MKTLITALFLFAGVSLSIAQLPTSLPSGGGAGIGDLVGQFAGDALSPDALGDDFNVDKFVKDAKGISDAASIGTHVNNLIGHIKPGMFKDGVDANKLLDMGNSVKGIADAAGLLKNLDNGLLGKAFKSDWSSKRPDVVPRPRLPSASMVNRLELLVRMMSFPSCILDT